MHAGMGSWMPSPASPKSSFCWVCAQCVWFHFWLCGEQRATLLRGWAASNPGCLCAVSDFWMLLWVGNTFSKSAVTSLQPWAWVSSLPSVFSLFEGGVFWNADILAVGIFFKFIIWLLFTLFRVWEWTPKSCFFLKKIFFPKTISPVPTGVPPKL